MKKINKIFLRTDGQAMTEYVLIAAFVMLVTIPAIKIIPKAFAAVFNKIISFHSLHLDTLARSLSSLF